MVRNDQAVVKSEVELLKESTETMNKKRVKIKIKELESALKGDYRGRERAKVQLLNEDFEKIYACLKKDEDPLEKAELLRKRETLRSNIKLNGATSLNVAKLNNNQAKLNIIKYEPIIREAATSTPSDAYPVLAQSTNKRRVTIFTGLAVGVLATAVAGFGILPKMIKKIQQSKGTTTTTIGTTLDGDATSTIYTEDTIKESSETIMSTSDYSIETVNNDYVSPSYTTNTDGYSNGNTGSGNATYETVGTTHNPTDVEVISTPSTTESTTAPAGTSAIPTDINGTQADQTEPEIKPTGTDPLPVEPTTVTVAPTTETTSKPTETTPSTTETTSKPTYPTVDPDDPINVRDDVSQFTIKSAAKSQEYKGLKLVLVNNAYRIEK